MNIRIAKFIARSGLFSRREAEKVIVLGDVTVNGEVITNLAHKLVGDEEVCYKGKNLPKIEETRIWLYHKREGLITTSFDPEGRETIFDDIQNDIHLIPVGRLDKNTEGLIVLTNDGEYSRQLELPSSNIERTYHVKIFGNPHPSELEELENGIEIEGVFYRQVKAIILEQSANNSWLEITLVEGKNREIRNILNYLGYRIKRLIRVQYGPYKLGNLPKGEIIEVEKKC